MRFNDEKALTYIGYWDSVGSAYTARTPHTNCDLFSDTAVIGDWVLFKGTNNTYERDLFFTINTALAGAGVTGIWEFSHNGGGNWYTLTSVDGTSDLTTSGNVTWDVANASYNAQLWVRYRITAGTITEGGHITKGKTGDNTLYIENADDTTFQLIKTAVNTGGWNCIDRPQSSAVVDRLDHYLIRCQMIIENGGRIADNTWGSAIFNVFGGNDVGCTFWVKAGGELQLGALNANGDGISPFDITTVFGQRHGNAKMAFYNDGTLKLYAGSIYSESTNISGTLDARNSTLYSINRFDPTMDADSHDLQIGSTARGWIEYAYSTYYAVNFYGVPRMGTFRGDADFYDCKFYAGWWLKNDSTNTLNFVGCSPKPNYLSLTRNNTTWLWKHRVNVSVRDENGDEIEDATVVCKDIDGVTVFTEETGATGIDEQEVIEEQYTGTGTIYTGEGGDTDMRTPHTLTVSKDGYDFRTVKVTIDKAIHKELVGRKIRKQPIKINRTRPRYYGA